MKAAYGANVSLKEWNRKGWTYHAKGWFPADWPRGHVLINRKRDMDTANTFITSYDDPIWFYQLELSVVKPRYRIILHHDDPGKQRQ